MRGLNAIAASQRQFEPEHSVRAERRAAARRTSLRGTTAADLAQLVGELGDELVRYHADRRLRLDRAALPPSTDVVLVATMPSPARDSSPGPTLRAVTTVTVKR